MEQRFNAVVRRPCVEYRVTVTTPLGIGRVVSLWECSRTLAIAAAERAVPGTRVTSVVVLFRGLGRCGNCEIPLFADMNLRPSGDGFKCRDCA